MGWFRKEDESKIPEELRGLKPEEVVDRIRKGALAEDLGTKAAELKAAKEAAEAKNAENDNVLAQMRSRMATLEANQKPPAKKEEVEAIDFSLDPEGAVNQRIANSVTPVAAALLQSNAQMARFQAKQHLDRIKMSGMKISKGVLFDRYSNEIDTLAKTTRIDQLQSSDSWVHLFDMVVGKKMDEILSSVREGKFETMFAEGGAVSGDNDRHEKVADDKPSLEEIRIAKRMGVKIEDYLKNKKEMVGVE